MATAVPRDQWIFVYRTHPVPGTWRHLLDNVDKESRGTGRYSLTFSGNSQPQELALYIPRMWSAKRIYLRYPSGDVHTLIDVGDPTDVNNTATTPVGRQLFTLPSIHPGTQLIFELGAYDTIYSGLWQAPRLGHSEYMQRNDTLKKSLTSAITATLLLFAALNFALWRVRFRNQAMMILPIGAICLALRQFNDADLMAELIPSFTASQDATFSWLTFLVGVAAGFFYVMRRFRSKIPGWLGIVPIALSLAGIVLVLFADHVVVQQYGKILRPVVVAFAFAMFALLAWRSSTKSLDNRLTLLGIGLIITALAIDIAHYHIYASGFLVPINSFAWIFFVASQLYLLSWRYFATMQRNIRLNDELSELNENLELRIQQRTEELNEKNRQLEQLYKTDALTGLANRRAMADFAGQEFARIKRYSGCLTITLIDIDFFKQVNDQYGHQAGDETLKAIAGVLQGSVREVDMVARWGGEEFCIAFPEIDQSQAFRIMERIRLQIQDLSVETDEGRAIRVTISSGIAHTTEHTSLEKLIASADEALYQAKSRGRNCTLCQEPDALPND